MIADAGWRQTDVASSRPVSTSRTRSPGVPAAALLGAPLLLTKNSCVPRPVGTVANSLNPSGRLQLGAYPVLQDSASATIC